MTNTSNIRVGPILCAIVLAVSSSAVFAVEINFSCDVTQGFSFRADSQSSFGYITALSVGTTAIRADLTVGKDPVSGAAISAVGVLSQVSWSGGTSDPVSFKAQVSSSNKQLITSLLHQTPLNTQAQIGFVVFSYDPIAKKYYKAFFPASGATLTAAIAKSGTSPLLAVVSESGSVANPLNYQMSSTVAPPPFSQKLQLATTSSIVAVKSWGVSTQ